MKKTLLELAIVAVVSHPAVAANRFWDMDGATPGGSSGTTASGSWSPAAPHWSTSADGVVATQVWNSGDVAVFSAGSDVTGSSTITVIGTQTVSGITLEEGTVSLLGGANTINLNPGSIINVVSSTLSIAAEFVGSDFTKTGAGTLGLDGSDHSYTGGTNIAQGTLRLGAADRIPNGSAITVASGATFDVNGFDETIGSLSGTGSLELDGGNLTTGGDDSSTTFSGTITGSNGGVLRKTGSGTFILSGNNANTDAVVAAGGTLSGNTIANVGTNSAFGNGTTDSRLIMANGATLEYTGSNASTNRAVVLDIGGGSMAVTNAATTLTVSGVVSGEAGLTKTGSGTLRAYPRTI
jgi:autotransporter-associated beta strand protein